MFRDSARTRAHSTTYTSSNSEHSAIRLTHPGGPELLATASSYTGDGYHIRMISQCSPQRADADRLVREMYAHRGLDTPKQATAHSPATHDATLAAYCGDRIVGTLTVRIDIGHGLFADAQYREEIDAVRAEGGVVCEVGRLAMDRSHKNPEALRRLMQQGFRVARDGYSCTDSFIEVHPRHARFYLSKLGFSRAGPETTCPRVNAPAVLMHLDLCAENQVGILSKDSRSRSDAPSRSARPHAPIAGDTRPHAARESIIHIF